MSRVVGITCSSGHPEGRPANQFLNLAYIRAIENAGGVPVILPAVTNPEAIGQWLGVVDGLLFSGGVDIEPSRFGEEAHPSLGEVDLARDATEIPLIMEAIRQDVPIFAICRGLQLLNVALGGTLYQDLPAERPSDLEHDQKKTGLPRNAFSHSVCVLPNSRLRSLTGSDEMQANSFHHQAIRTVAPGLTVTATAPDGVIEGVERPGSRYLVAVQFHPEDTAPTDERSRRLFSGFVETL